MSGASRDDGRIALDEDVVPLPPGAGGFRVLALSGGGYRGLFTARVLERLEADHGPLAARFDLVAGTSIGSIIAGALALGTPATTIRETIAAEGAAIFPARGRLGRRVRQLGALLRAPYDAAPLERAIEAVLGERADLPLADVAHPLLVPAVSHTRAEARLFRSGAVPGARRDTDATLREAMLASAAAPTYFAPRALGTETLIDGSVIANAPEVVALGDALARFRAPLDEIHVLAVGTASPARARAPADGGRDTRLGTLAWMARSLLEVTMAAQEDLAIRHCRAVLDERYLRLDRAPAAAQGRALALDRADATATRTLSDLADACYDAALEGDEGVRLSRILGRARGLAGRDTPAGDALR